jgi:hypothetical protein
MDGSEELHFENIIFRAQFISSWIWLSLQ